MIGNNKDVRKEVKYYLSSKFDMKYIGAVVQDYTPNNLRSGVTNILNQLVYN